MTDWEHSAGSSGCGRRARSSASAPRSSGCAGALGRDGDDGARARTRRAVQKAGGDRAAAAARTQAAPTIPTRSSIASTRLILAGGTDVDPEAYGAEPHPETDGAWPERDALRARARPARALDARHAGAGHLPGDGDAERRLRRHARAEPSRPDRLRPPPAHARQPSATTRCGSEPGSLAARAAGAERLAVKSHHHQGVDELGEGLVAPAGRSPTTWSRRSSCPGGAFALGVLWHPEEDVAQQGHRLRSSTRRGTRVAA